MIGNWSDAVQNREERRKKGEKAASNGTGGEEEQEEQTAVELEMFFCHVLNFSHFSLRSILSMPSPAITILLLML